MNWKRSMIMALFLSGLTGSQGWAAQARGAATQIVVQGAIVQQNAKGDVELTAAPDKDFVVVQSAGGQVTLVF